MPIQGGKKNIFLSISFLIGRILSVSLQKKDGLYPSESDNKVLTHSPI